jgi:cystathionine beta-lyase
MSDTHDTRLDLLHEDRGDYRGAFNPPIYRASTFNQPSLEHWLTPEASRPPNYIYGREANPTTRVFEELIARIEHADDAVAFASGMGAITASILAFLGHGDHVLMVSHAYGPARDFLQKMAPRMALTAEMFEPGTNIEALMRPNTKLVYLESPTSAYFEMLDLRAIGRIARAHGAISIADNTWATPLYQQPLELGIDISLHSGTKYINGHSDTLCGVAATSNDLMKTLRPMAVTLGATLSPEDAYLCIRGLRTLAIRMPHHMENGLAVAHWLHNHPLVERVLHPALPDSPDYALWQSQMSGASGLFSVALRAGPEGAAAAFANSLKLFGLAPSWGGFESLLAPVEVKPNQPAVFRLAIGLEPVDALIADLEQALVRYGEFISQPARA